jgi:hypothetical protein
MWAAAPLVIFLPDEECCVGSGTDAVSPFELQAHKKLTGQDKVNGYGAWAVGAAGAACRAHGCVVWLRRLPRSRLGPLLGGALVSPSLVALLPHRRRACCRLLGHRLQVRPVVQPERGPARALPLPREPGARFAVYSVSSYLNLSVSSDYVRGWHPGHGPVVSPRLCCPRSAYAHTAIWW